MIEVNDRKCIEATKLPRMPLIEYLREPFQLYVEGRPRDEYLFADAPRPSNPKLQAGHEAWKWFGRFFQKNGVGSGFHELRDTWIEAAEHSAIERDIWQIIGAHSESCVSDRYGGKKPDVLLAVNEMICGFLTRDAEIMNSVCRSI